jgi:hypothetical protein
VQSLYRLKALECGVLFSSPPKFSRAFFSKLWRVVHKAFPVLLCDVTIEASFVGAKQAKQGYIVALCCFKGKQQLSLSILF